MIDSPLAHESLAAELLCLLNLVKLTPHQHQRIKTLANMREILPSFSQLVQANSAWLFTAQRISEAGLLDVSHLYDWVLEQSNRIGELQEHGKMRHEELSRFLKAAHEEKIQVILLKGALFGPALYGNPVYKKMNDVDILVRREDAKRVLNLMRNQGFSSVGLLLGRSEIPKDSHHSPPLISQSLKSVVGLHWGLCSPFSVWKPDIEAIWSRKQNVETSDFRAWRMSWEDNLLHLCIHLPFYKTGVRELADVYNLCLSSNPRMDWNTFSQEVEKWKAQDAAYRVLSLAQQLVPMGVPLELLSRWRKSSKPFTVSDTQKRLAFGHRLVSLRSVHIAKVEKAFSVFRLSENYSEKLLAWAATWKLTFWPTTQELARLCSDDRVPHSKLRTLLARIRAPKHCLGALTRDYGNLAVVVITLMNIGIVLRETVLRPFRGARQSLRMNPAIQILEALE